MHRTVNAKVLFVLLGTVLVLGTCIHFLHAHQMWHNTRALARQAQRALAEGELDRAVNYLDRYLTFVPGDTEALAQLGQVLDRMADGPEGRRQALQQLEQVLRREPSRQDLRRRVVSLAIDLYQFHDALDHLDALLPTAPEAEKGELEHLVGWCQDALGHPDQAVAAFRRALQHAPERVSTYVLLAEVLGERLGKSEEAAQVMNALVTANPRSAEALLARARFLEAREDVAGAARDIAQARSLDPTRADLALAAAGLARQKGKLGEARALLQQSLQVQPRSASLYVALAEIELRAGRPADAVTCLRQGLKELPEAADLLGFLADLLLDAHNLPEAEVLVARLRKLPAPPVRTAYLEGRILMEQGQWREAVPKLEGVRPLVGSVPAWASQVEMCLGQCHAKLGDADAELVCFRQAFRLNPSSSVVHYTLTLALLATDNLNEALAELDRVGAGSEAPPAMWADLYDQATRLLVQRRRFAEADRVVRQAARWGLVSQDQARRGAEAALAQRDPARALLLARQAVPLPARDPRDLLWLARVMEAVGRPYEAVQVLRTTVDKGPAAMEVWAGLVGALARSRRAEEAQATLEEAVEKLPPERAALGQARCFESLGHTDKADDQYRKCLEGRPWDVVLLRTTIDFFRRTDQPHKAEPLLRRLLDPQTQAPPDYRARARRQLAMVLAASGKEEAYHEAVALLRNEAAGRGANVLDERARAVVLASRPAQRLEGLRRFEDSLKGHPVSEEDQFLHAQLCESAGMPQRAQLLILDLLATNPENPQYLAFHVRSLLRKGDRNAVRFFLDKLEIIEPQSPRTNELRALLAEN